MSTRLIFACSALLVLALLVVIPQTHGRPYRQKRVSDQRLAELETIMALRKIAGKLVSVPVAYGQLDPAKIGRRRRRSAELLLQELLNTQANDVDDVEDNDGEDDFREMVGQHRPSQAWLSEWNRRVQG